MGAEASISETGLVDIIQLIHLQRKSGILTVVDGLRRITVSFRNGMLVGSEDPAHPIQEVGDLLVKGKKLTAVQLREIQYHQDTAKESLPLAIEKSGYVSQTEVGKAVAAHLREIFMDLFKLKAGTYGFNPQDVASMSGLVTPLSTEFLIMEGMRRLEEWPYVHKIVPNLKVVFRRTSSVPSGLDKTPAAQHVEDGSSDTVEGLSNEEISVYKLVDGDRTVKAIMEETPLSEFEVCRGLSSLASAGFIAECTASPTHASTSDSAFRRLLAFRRTVLVELLSTIGLISILFIVSIKLVSLWGSPEGVGQVYREAKAREAVETVRLAVKAFKLDRGKAPAELGSLVRNGYLDSDTLRDPFTGNALAYMVTNLGEDIYSAGADGVLGTTDDLR